MTTEEMPIEATAISEPVYASAVVVATVGSWRYRMGNCSAKVCVLATCLPYHLYGRLAKTIFETEYPYARVVFYFALSVLSSIGIFFQPHGDFVVLVSLGTIATLVAQLRKEFRSRYAIPTSECGAGDDWCISFWCTPCTLSQMTMHEWHGNYSCIV